MTASTAAAAVAGALPTATHSVTQSAGSWPPGGPVMLAVVCGIGVAAGLLLIGSFITSPDDNPGRGEAVAVRRRPQVVHWPGMRAVLRLAWIAATAAVIGAVTGWPVAAVLAGAGAWLLPGLLRVEAGQREQAARMEAVAVWTEMLRDTIASAAGIEQAITATSTAAPPAIAEQVHALRERLHAGVRLPWALRAFADEVAEPGCDLVVAALVLASQHPARRLGELLASLAGAIREQVRMRERVWAARARTQTSVRVIVVTTVGMATGLALLDRAYLAPYDSPAGQLVLAAIGALFAAGLAWLRQIVAFTPAPRLLTGRDAPTQHASSTLAGPSAARVATAPDRLRP